MATIIPNQFANAEDTIQLSKLDDKERAIIKMYFGIDGEAMTLEAIGDEFDLTKERIRQIKSKAINKIRANAIDLFKYFE